MKKNRKAIAMIELIFSIVVMGIAMLAIPMITSQTTKSSQSALMQESISEVAANISMILALPWDNAYNLLSAPALEVHILASDSTNFSTKAGLTLGVNARFYPPLADRKATSNVADTNYDDISDYNGRTTNVLVYSNQENEVFNGDYADTAVRIASTVVYYPDATNGQMGATTVFDFNPTGDSSSSTNIKRITTTLTTTTNGLNKNIVLNAFSCNIGSAPSTTRVWP